MPTKFQHSHEVHGHRLSNSANQLGRLFHVPNRRSSLLVGAGRGFRVDRSEAGHPSGGAFGRIPGSIWTTCKGLGNSFRARPVVANAAMAQAWQAPNPLYRLNHDLGALLPVRRLLQKVFFAKEPGAPAVCGVSAPRDSGFLCGEHY